MIKIFVVSIFVVLSTACSRDDSILNPPSSKLNSSIEDSLLTCDIKLESQFDIELVYLADIDSVHKSLFRQAADRWEEVVIGDLDSSRVPDNFSYYSDLFEKEISIEKDFIDDLVIYIDLASNNSPLNFDMYAEVRFINSDSKLPSVGEIIVYPNAFNKPFFYKLAMHEIGHVLGIGSYMSFKSVNLVSCLDDENSVPFFKGWVARLLFKQLFGDRYDGPIVPLTPNSTHWPREIFGRELMTPLISTESSLSSITVAALGDLGYEVDPLSADYYHAPPEIPFAGKPIANTVVCTRPEIVHEFKSIE